jgi:hypothetical protein
MWKRLRRRTMAPSRPAVYPDQWGLVAVIAMFFAAGVYGLVRVLLG